MKRREKDVEEFVLRHLGLFKAPPEQEMHLAETRIENRLCTAPVSTEPLFDAVSRIRRARAIGLALAIGAAAAAVALVVFLQSPSGIDAHAVVADGFLSRVSESKTEIVHAGERIEAGEIARTGGAVGTITLADGSRVELRSQTEFSLERATDGVRIHLIKGSVIINAARQVAGHLYVQTKDLTVSVIGTVFLVNAEAEGSRVAVIEGEVRVQQGEETKNLLPGEQISTNPKMESLPVQEEVSWSRQADVHVALLQQSATPPVARPSPETRVSFEVASIRPSAPLPGAGGRGVAGGGAPRPAESSPLVGQARAELSTCGGPGSQLSVDPGRFVLTGATVYRLIVLGYGLKDCGLSLQMGLISGGPEWMKSERFDIQATIPEGSPVYTRQQLNSGEAPKLQMMIQALLADRFNVVLHREAKDLPAFNLVMAKAGRIKLSEDQTPPAPPVPGQGFRANALPRGVMLNCTGSAIAISQMANCLQKNMGGTIIDKTDLKGLYDIPPLTNPDPSIPMRIGQSYVPQLLEQLGLKLDPTKAPGEIVVIERVEKPSEN